MWVCFACYVVAKLHLVILSSEGFIHFWLSKWTLHGVEEGGKRRRQHHWQMWSTFLSRIQKLYGMKLDVAKHVHLIKTIGRIISQCRTGVVSHHTVMKILKREIEQLWMWPCVQTWWSCLSFWWRWRRRCLFFSGIDHNKVIYLTWIFILIYLHCFIF